MCYITGVSWVVCFSNLVVLVGCRVTLALKVSLVLLVMRAREAQVVSRDQLDLWECVDPE